MLDRLLIIGSDTIHTHNYIGLIRKEFRQIVLVTDAESPRFSYDVEESHCIGFSLKNPVGFLAGVRRLRRIIRNFKPDVVHSLQISTNSLQVLLANRRTAKPMIFTALGSDVLHTPGKGLLYRAMVKYVLRHGQHFTADASFMLEVMEGLAGRRLNTIIANFGAQIDEGFPLVKENIFYSNRQLKPLYRIDRIIGAFRKFLENTGDRTWKLVIAAEGDQKDALKRMVQDYGLSQNVEFAGWLNKKQNDVNYQKARFYVSVPESDGTSISLLEAMGYGCIPILSDLKANREWVESGVNGLIVADLESDFFAEAMKIDQEKAMAMNRAIIAERGTKEVNREKFAAFYSQIIADSLKPLI